MDRMAFVCIDRLAGRGYDDELRAFLVNRAKTIEAGELDFWERCELRDIREWQKRLEK